MCVRVCLCECACLFWVREALVRGSIRPGGIGVLVSDKVAVLGQEGVAAFFFNFFLDRSRASVQVDLHNRLRKCGIIGAVTLNNLPSLGHHQERQPFLDLNDIRGIDFF